MQLGEIRIEGVRDGTSYLSADFFGKTEGEAHASMLGDDGRLQLPIAGFVIQTGGKRVLMDAGMGPVTMSGNPTKVPRRGWKAAVFPRRCPPGDTRKSTRDPETRVISVHRARPDFEVCSP